MGKRDVFFVAGGALALAGCALVLGIDDVTTASDAAPGDDATVGDTQNTDSPASTDSSFPLDASFDGDAGPCSVCAGFGETTECALACDMPAPSGIAVDNAESYVYFTNGGLDPNGAGGSIWKVPLPGGVAPELLEDAGLARPAGITFASGRNVILYTLEGASSIRISDGGLQGASPWANATAPTGIAWAFSSKDVVFFKSSGMLVTASLDDPAASAPFVGEPINDFGVSASAGEIGWTTTSPNDVFASPVSGGGALLAGAQSNAFHVAVNGGATTTFVWSTDRAGGGAELHTNGVGTTASDTIWSGLSVGGMQFAPDNTTLYFSDTIAGVVSVLPLGGSATTLATNQENPQAVVVTTNWVLWVTRGSGANATGRVMRLKR